MSYSPEWAPDAPLYGLDIETDTRLDGLDPRRGGVVAVALSTDRGDEIFLGDEPALLTALQRRLDQLEPGVLVTWNGRGFDLPFLESRSLQLGLPLGLHGDGTSGEWPPEPGRRWRWGRHGHLDGLAIYRADVRRVLDISCGLKSLALLLGLDPVRVDYDAMHELDDSEMAAYVASDARIARELVRRRLPSALAWVDRPDPDERAATGYDTPVPAVDNASRS